MPQYVSTIRTSFFGVRNPAEFKKFCDRFGLDVEDRDSSEHATKLYAFTQERGEQSLKSSFYDEGRADDIDADTFLEELSRQLAEGWTAIITEIGTAGIEVVKGRATALSWRGETRVVDLHDIHKLAQELAGKITLCEG